jgi:uncharacterized Rossmann fold enzyme
MSVAFDKWEPVYERILADFGYERTADERARNRLAELLVDKPRYEPRHLDWEGKTVAVAGGASTLRAELDTARSADVVVAASVAADRLRDEGIAVGCLVTDLDKNPETVGALTEEEIPVAVHAHGDNIPAINAVIPTVETEYVLPTTQARPNRPVRNFGGFTDGDRAAFLADWAGAETLHFPGWDFDDPTVRTQKARKLAWAERLLYWLEHRREAAFEVLDGRRESIDTTPLPIE